MIGTMKMFGILGVLGASMLATQTARADHGGFSIGIGINTPVRGGYRGGSYIVPPPTYFQPTFVAPAPTYYYQPAPTYYYQPAYQPTYYAPPVYYSSPTYYSSPSYYGGGGYYNNAYCAPQPRLTFGLVGRGRW